MSTDSIPVCPVCGDLLYRSFGEQHWRCWGCERGERPTVAAVFVADELRAQNDLLARCVRTLTAEVRAEHEQRTAAQAALREVMAELRQVCVVLGGAESERSALDLASEVRLALDLQDAVQARHVERGDRYRRRALALLSRLRAYRRWRWLDTAKTKKLMAICGRCCGRSRWIPRAREST